jgi:antitoxin VapB
LIWPLSERLEREQLRPAQPAGLAKRLMERGRHCAALPDCDTRSPDDIVGYDDNGMW